MSAFQNVRDGKPFPPLAARVPAADVVDEPAPEPEPPIVEAPKSTAAKRAAASTTTSGESAVPPQGESA